MARNTPKTQSEEYPTLSLDKGSGRMANALSKAIAYERIPSLFDEEFIKERDAEIYKLQQQQSKEKLPTWLVDRRDKPVYLTSIQDRIIHALSYGISREMETKDDVKRKINYINSEHKISRYLYIDTLTYFIFGSLRERNKETIKKELDNLGTIRQLQILESVNMKITAPLIKIGAKIEKYKKDGAEIPERWEIEFGTAFFIELDKRYSIITPKLFEVWRKSGRATDLFSTLLSSILSVYWSHKQAANIAEEQTKKYYKTNKISREELKEAIAEARCKAMTYELDVSTIKRKVVTNYDSSRTMKRKFWTDLNNAIAGFVELDLIKEGRQTEGAKGQKKIQFILSETYNYSEKVEHSPNLLENEADNNTPNTF